MEKLTFISTPSHGYLKVASNEVPKGIVNKISQCSVKIGSYWYLEEDCDCQLFLDWYTSKNNISQSDLWDKINEVYSETFKLGGSNG